ncbi:MAG: SDR family NAD(P)-dependent oxidoreductase, partial [Chloroflexi bacterium]|nr:SDR family NAD(P)-dependent oxidoreductase [Chloroflexota bacterium]
MVTGAANGIGKALAIGLAEAGASIVVADLPSQRENALDTAREIQARGAQALVLDLDVTSLPSIEA